MALTSYMENMIKKPVVKQEPKPLSDYSNGLKTFRDQSGKTANTVTPSAPPAPSAPVFKSAAPFSYDANSDPSYQAALRQAQQGAQTATNNATVALGARGIGNSSIAIDRGNQIQQQAIGNVNDTILPQLMSQAYGRYQDQNQNDYRDALANYNVGRDKVGDAQWQTTRDDGRTDQADNLALSVSDRTGNYQSPENAKYNAEMLKNSAAYGGASPEDRVKLHDRNLVLAQMLGKTYDPKTGAYTGGSNSTRTIAGQTLDSNKQQEHIDLAQKLSEMYGVHVDPKNDPALAYKQVAGLVPLNKQKQDFDQADTVATREHNFANDDAQLNISQQNANTSSASVGNSASSAKIGQLFDAWKARRKAPKGLESLGINEGDVYGGEEKPDSKGISSSAYSEFLVDKSDIADKAEGLALVDLYRSKGVDEPTLQKMLKEINTLFKLDSKE